MYIQEHYTNCHKRQTHDAGFYLLLGVDEDTDASTRKRNDHNDKDDVGHSDDDDDVRYVVARLC